MRRILPRPDGYEGVNEPDCEQSVMGRAHGRVRHPGSRVGLWLVVVLFAAIAAAVNADVPTPVIRQFRLNPDGSVLLRWDAVQGCSYTVQSKSSLASGSWNNLDVVTAASNSVAWKAPGQAGAASFYRLATSGLSIQSVEPTVLPTNTPTTIYISGQGFDGSDTVTASGAGGTLPLTPTIISSTLMSVVVPGFTPDKVGDYQLQVASGSGSTATYSYAWSVVSAPANSLALLEPPEEPPVGPSSSLLMPALMKAKEKANRTRAKQGGLFEIEDYSFDVEQTLNIGSQSSGAGAGKVSFNPFSITRKVDAASPSFFKLVAVKTIGWAHDDEAPKESVDFTFKLVAVKTISWAHDDEAPKESVSMSKPAYKLVAVKTIGWAHDDEAPKETRAYNPNLGSQSSGAGAGKVSFNPFSITRKVDAASPSFFKLVPVKTIGWAHDDEAPKETVASSSAYSFKLVAVKTISWAHDDEAPKETMTFEYGSLKTRYTSMTHEGDRSGTDCDDNDPKRHHPTFCVMPFSGEVQCQSSDLVIPGRSLPFDWTLTYRSRTAARPGMSQGWTHSYDIAATQTGSDIAVEDGTGRSDVYHLGTDGTYTRDGFFAVGTLSNNVFTLTYPDSGKVTFNPFSITRQTVQASQIVDRNGNTVSLFYDASDRLAEIVDDLGRTNSVAYNAAGQLSSLTDFSGRMVTYQYYSAGEPGGSPGDLKSITSPAVTGTPTGNDFPAGKTWTFTYSTGNANDAENHLLLTCVNPLGQTVRTFTYDHNSGNYSYLRCLTTQRGTETPAYYSYEPLTPAPANHYGTLLVTVRDEMGNVADCTYNSRNLPVDCREYTGRAPVVGFVTSVSNRPVNPVRPTDPAFYESQWTWTRDLLLKQEIKPQGDSVQCVYRQDFGQVQPVKHRADLVACHYTACCADVDGDGVPEALSSYYQYADGFGSPAVDCRAAFLSKKGYDKYQALAAAGLGSGGGGSSRELKITSGQPTIIDNKKGLLISFCTSATDPNGIVSTAAYDSNGNLKTYVPAPVIVINPTFVMDFSYNSQGQLTGITNPPDANGYRRVDVLSYFSSGAQGGYLQSVTEDAGGLALTTSFERNERGCITRCIDPRGNDRLFTLNALDQVLQASSPQLSAGSAGTFRITSSVLYDADDNITQVSTENRDQNGALSTTMPSKAVLFTYDSLERCTQMQQLRDPLHYVSTQCQYDGLDNLVLFRSGEAVNGDNANNVVQYLYDERNLLLSQLRAPGTTLVERNDCYYDLDGRLTQASSTCSTDTSCTQPDCVMAYDGLGRLVSVTDAMGNVGTCAYDNNGNLVHARLDGELADVSGSAGNLRLAETFYTYDALDRCVKEKGSYFNPSTQAAIHGGTSVATCLYAPNGECLSVTDDNGHVRRFTYDTEYRLVSVIDPKTNTVSVVYDGCGNIVTAARTDLPDTGGKSQVFTATCVYDGLNRCTSCSDGAGNTAQYFYDSCGNLVAAIDPNGNLSGCVYDGLNRRTAELADLNKDGVLDFVADAHTTYSYDDNGCLLSRTDSNTNSTSYAYDALDRRTSAHYADGTARTWTYDLRDNVHQAIDPNGTTVTCVYDGCDRLVSRTVGVGPGSTVATTTTFETYAYDGCSRLVLASNDVSRLTYAYDSLGDCISDSQDGLTSTGTYDGAGNCLSITYPSGRVFSYTYDAADQVSGVSTSGGGLPPSTLATYSYAGPGRLSGITRNNNVTTAIVWDGMTSPPNVTGDLGFQQVTHVGHAGAGGVIDHRRLAYDANQNKILRAQVTEFVPGQGTRSNFWSYTPLDMMAESVTTKGNAQSTQDYSLDAVGNRLTVSSNGVAGVYTRDSTIPPGDFQMDRYTSTPFGGDQYDANGNRVQVASAISGTAYAYDYANRLVAVSDLSSGVPTLTASFSYDALGRRISKTVYPPSPMAPIVTYYVHDGEETDKDCGGPEIEQRSGGPGGGVTHVYCWGGATRMGRPAINTALASFSGAGALEYYFLNDELGNVLALADAGGNVMERYEYGDFGGPQFLTADGIETGATSSAQGNPFLFRGMEWDGETGLYCVQYRETDFCFEAGSAPPSRGYYDTASGRYLMRAGVPLRFGDNAYSFAGNNPWSVGSAMKNGRVKFFNDAKGF